MKKDNKKEIVFFEPFPTVMGYKLAKKFKEKGYKTVSIRLLKFDKESEKFYKDVFDKIISFDISFVKMRSPIKFILTNTKNIQTFINSYSKLLSLNPKVVIARATPSLPIFLLKKIFKKWPIIYFPYDIRGQIYPSKYSAKKNGLNNFEIYAERFCFENCTGIMHKGAPDELKYLNGRMLGKNISFAPELSFLPPCSKEFSVEPKIKNKKSGEIHLVYLGSFGISCFDDAPYLFKNFTKLLDQKLHINIYMKSNTLSLKESFKTASTQVKKVFNSKYFHIHPPKNPKEIIKEIAKYDFGVWFHDYYTLVTRNSIEPKFATGNKFTSYLEAGIPFIYSVEFEFIDKLMHKYGMNSLGIKKIEEVGEAVKKVNYNDLVKKVRKMREDLDINNSFPKLISFINLLTRNKS